MPDVDSEPGWRQHFPTYRFDERDIALEEYKTASKTLENEERVFIIASNIAILAFAGLGSLAVGSLNRLIETFKGVLSPITVVLVLLSITVILTIQVLRYFAHRQKSIVFAARKVIVLRRMLGLSYGTIRLVLPNWRIEGADEPLALRLFPGWHTYAAIPFYMVCSIFTAVFFFLAASLLEFLGPLKGVEKMPLWGQALIPALLCAIGMAYLYRKAHFDTHERPSLLLARRIAWLLRLRLVSNFEYTIYRANLARYEVIRLGIDLQVVKRFLIFMEDRTFLSHRGISAKACARAFLSLFGIKRRSGGSTITQQLVRTLFITQPEKLVRRKAVELLLALWFDSVFQKQDQLDVYLASVRFERATYGIIAAMRHFFGRVVTWPTPAEAFFLIERVSNIRSQLLVSRIEQIVASAVQVNLLNRAEVIDLRNLYRAAVKSGKITDSDHQLMTLLSTYG